MVGQIGGRYLTLVFSGKGGRFISRHPLQLSCTARETKHISRRLFCPGSRSLLTVLGAYRTNTTLQSVWIMHSALV